ncbi:MAG: hypothetical protein JRH18_03600 [Deltaproteobacteria bacterium]|nr:hypothetical protein [Deltaproteobacteria bacterium]MBW1960865.1 hypothetical protein [Deltaproteobacteria bacterium]MBW1994348.1 hypothetical protein [Deltaproteobacteria bacterium]MBW2150733.1 hypothetical protein [Deltaproteobacteria bacterium]
MYGRKSGLIFLMVCFAILGLIFSGNTVDAEAKDEEKDQKPKRFILMAAEYPGVEVPPDEDVSIDLVFHNKGRTDETLDVWIAQQPEAWKSRIKTYRYTVMGVHVPADEDKTITFEAEPPKDVKTGEYAFQIKAKTADGKFELSQEITIRIRAKEEGVKDSKGVRLTTSYPVLRGPSDAIFEFSIEVDSKLDKEAVFDLFAQGPEGWDINFKPAYEDKYISSLRLKENGSKTVAVVVKPTPRAKEGEYPIDIRVTSGNAKAKARLVVLLTGTYGLEVGTPTGLLSLEARQGKPANMSIYVKNTGSATNNNIRFMSFKPENWSVEFKPETIDAIEPGDLKQVEVAITPYEEALVGDYSVSVNVEGEKVSKPIEFRVTVNASTAWGWIGIGIIILVIFGLTGLFRWLGRR